MQGFAKFDEDLSYWKRQNKPLFPDLAWNIPEQKTNHVLVAGGNAQSFSTVIRTAEYLNQTFPIKHITTLLPDALRAKVPNSENINFAPSTSSGSFAKSAEFNQLIASADFTLFAGDISRNAETAIAVTEAIKQSSQPLLLSRDALDLISPTAEPILNHESTFLIGSMIQIQKIFRAVYYPRMIMLSQPLVPVIETLHKFTLTYPVTIITFHQKQIIVASGGQISTTHLLDTNFSPISLWSGSLAANIVTLNLFNPHKAFEATTAAILFDK